MRARVLTLAVLLAAVQLVPLPAQAAARVTIANPDGRAVVDTTYGTTLDVSGSGFQSVRNGHGGIYVFFGTVKGTWRPSQGGRTGQNYFYVPDSESAGNQGFQRYVAFPGSDTGAAANGGQISADGSWRTRITVPGAVFQAVDRQGRATEIDCRRVQCGIITVGAHGVVNGSNETFTPVTVDDIYEGEPPAEAAQGAAPRSGGAAATAPSEAADADPAAPADEDADERADGTATAAAAPLLQVDRAAAVPGRIMTFDASGLVPGDLVVATLDDGLAAAGPIAVGTNGQVAGAIELPLDLEPGTHTLKLSGDAGTSVSFAVRSLDDDGGPPWVAVGVAGGAALLLLVALVACALWIRSARRDARGEAVVS